MVGPQGQIIWGDQLLVEPKKEKGDVVIEVELFRCAVAVELEDEAVAPGSEAC